MLLRFCILLVFGLPLLGFSQKATPKQVADSTIRLVNLMRTNPQQAIRKIGQDTSRGYDAKRQALLYPSASGGGWTTIDTWALVKARAWVAFLRECQPVPALQHNPALDQLALRPPAKLPENARRVVLTSVPTYPNLTLYREFDYWTGAGSKPQILLQLEVKEYGIAADSTRVYLYVTGDLWEPPVGAPARMKDGRKLVRPAQRDPNLFMTALEQRVLAEINVARTNPQPYLERLISLREAVARQDYTQGGRYPYPIGRSEGVVPIDEAIAHLRQVQQAPLQPVTPVLVLALAAQDHVAEGATGLFGHNSRDGSAPWDRAARYGYAMSGECISYGHSDAMQIVLQLLIDESVPSRGHRKILLDPKYRVASVACGPHPTYQYHAVIMMAESAAEAEGLQPRAR